MAKPLNPLAKRQAEYVLRLKADLQTAKAKLRRLRKATVVQCPSCGGDGQTAVYVGCDCTRNHPYDRRKCNTCDGAGWVETAKAL